VTQPDTEPVVGNPRFFVCTGPHSAAALASLIGCGVPTVAVALSGLASLEAAGPEQVSFIADPRHAGLLERTRAGAVLVTPELAGRVPQGAAGLVTPDPLAAWARVAALFHPVPPVTPGIHATAVVEPGAMVDPSAQVCARAVIGTRAEIGPRCRVGAGVVIGEGVVLGPDCRIGPNASISHAWLGARVYVYPGARIGQEGFGFTSSAGGFVTAPQLAGVIVGDDVEVGANTTIDRGALRHTVIGAGTRLDNLVQVAHNVRIGRYCAIAAQVGISGSVDIDDFVVIGGQAGVADHMRVGARARVGAQSGVMSEIAPGAVVVSSPARPVRDVFREIATLKRLARRPG
jgi:UDP-3-O-[3-hydroxymyristoyl] glucosamine N-acyltransferase